MNKYSHIEKKQKVEELCIIYNKVKSLRKVRKITGYSINTIKKYIKGKVEFPSYPKPLKEGYKRITKEKIRIYAHTIFDGYITRTKYNSYIVGYVNKNIELLKEFEKDVKFVYGLKPTRSKRENGVIGLLFSSKIMYLDIFNFNKDLINMNNEFKITYLRAFFDDEGCVSFYPKKGKFFISGSQKSQKELLFIQRLLSDLGIKSNLYKRTIEITLNKDIIKYNALIGFTHPKKRNKLLNALNYYKKKFEKINNQNLKIKELTKKGLNPYQMSPILNMPPSTIRNRINSGFKMNRYDYSK